MAVLLLQAAGAALGGVFGPIGTAVGQAAGALAGSLIDNSLLGGDRTVQGRSLAGARIPSAEEGTGIARVQGTARVAGTLIWATRFEEQVTVERAGGKGGGPKVETHSYFGNFAFGLCEGPIACVRRVWADGRELDRGAIEMRVHRGTDEQLPDPLIEAKQGTGNVPAWRGLAYVVFERLPLDGFGNRMPVFHFEVVRPIGDLENRIEAVTVIPGATEHGYALTPVSELRGPGERRYLNKNTRQGAADWMVSIDELQALCPRLKTVALVTAWMGTDLRAGHCSFLPGTEVPARAGESRPWRVGNLDRATARPISRIEGAPVYGGTPDDRAVIEAIRDLKARGLEVVLYPFVLMDIAPGNGLPDPYGSTEQAALPWRGRITAMPAPGLPGSPDGSSQIRADVAAFCGSTAPGDILVSGDRVLWTGGDDGYRRMILHHAGLALAAGGVDGFLIGSELRGLTRLRDETGAFPFVEALCELAADVNAMLGVETVVSYAADWSEYSGYAPADGSGDFFFNLDPLWAHPAIGAVGIDNYMPLSDWRDADLEAGNPDGERHGSDRGAFERAITAGEGFDWYYASQADRQNRIRTPITDGMADKPWVYRFKDIRGWWQNPHYDRVGGAEVAAPSAWVPASKPVWLTELGCPAADKGAVQPNVFPDPRSAEGALPYFSTGARDDAVQRAFLDAHLDHWSGPANADGMVATDRIFAWTWDARPYPAFPVSRDLWADGDNWRCGHWLNGRFGGADLAELFAEVLTRNGFARFDVSGISGSVSGHVVGGVASARQVLEPFMEAFAIDVREGPEGLVFFSRLKVARMAAVLDIVADLADEPRFIETRAQEGELPSEAMLRFFDPLNDYETASVRSRRLSEGNPRQHELGIGAAIDKGLAGLTVDLWLKDRWAIRRGLQFSLPPNRIDIEAGDLIRPDFDDSPGGLWRVARIEDGVARRIEAVGHAAVQGRERGNSIPHAPSGDTDAVFAPDFILADLPILRGAVESGWALAAAQVRPWRPMRVSASATEEGYAEMARILAPATVGRLAEALPASGCEGRVDHGASIVVDLAFGGLENADRTAILSGANGLALEAANGAWEIVQFERAEEIAAGRWRLTGLLRGQAGTDDAMAAGASAGARVFRLDGAPAPLAIEAGQAGLARNFIVEPIGLAGAGGVGPVSFAGGLRARTPLSPVHLKAARTGEGVRLTWIRRSRIDADNWLPADIPLGEERERYLVEILDGASVVRTAEVDAPEWLYPAADELADFGTPRGQIAFRVRQAGRHVPWGLPRSTSLTLS